MPRDLRRYEGRDPAWRRARDRIVAAVEPLRACPACGYRFPERLGRYGCPNCHGEGLDVSAPAGALL